jgi:hypothetical protein
MEPAVAARSRRGGGHGRARLSNPAASCRCPDDRES